MHKLKNCLFGYDYVIWKNTCDSGIARVRKTPDDVVWYYRYRTSKVVDRIKNPYDVIWLTCSPSKYFDNYGKLV